ncbi:MAG: helix-turn-helix transcriptional regulator [Deltaproteobacteria bacterium]|nr:helix-turn-helix transcriptional regulator [Deltaproteobacteria bacterium]
MGSIGSVSQGVGRVVEVDVRAAVRRRLRGGTERRGPQIVPLAVHAAASAARVGGGLWTPASASAVKSDRTQPTGWRLPLALEFCGLPPEMAERIVWALAPYVAWEADPRRLGQSVSATLRLSGMAIPVLQERGLSDAAVRVTLQHARHFFAVRRLIVGRSEQLGARPFGAELKLRHLSIQYRVPIPKPLRTRVLEAVIRLDGALPADWQGTLTPRHGVVQRVFPTAEPWLVDCAIHLLNHARTAPDDVRVVLRMARLLQGVATRDAEAHGFTQGDVELLELGKLRRIPDANSVAAKYGLSVERFGRTYSATHFPQVEWNRLRVLRPCVLDPADLPKVMAFMQRSPTLGEYLMAWRKQRGETMEAAGARIGRTPSAYDRLEANGAPPEWPTLATLLPRAVHDDVRRLCMATWYPELLDPERGYPHFIYERLEREPLYIWRRESDPVGRIRAYARDPGSPGEQYYFARLRRGLSGTEVFQQTGRQVGPQLLPLIERNIVRPTPEEHAALCALLQLDAATIGAQLAARSYPPMSRGIALDLVRADGSMDIARLRFRPTLRTFRALATVLNVPRGRLARQINARFTPEFQPRDFPSFQGVSIPFTSDDLDKLRAFHALGHQTVAEMMLFARLRPKRCWAARRAAAKLGMTYDRYCCLESRSAVPTPAELTLVAVVFEYDITQLRAVLAAEAH